MTTATLERTTLPPAEVETAASAARALSDLLPARPTARSRVTITPEGDPDRRLSCRSPRSRCSWRSSPRGKRKRRDGDADPRGVTSQEAANLLNVSRSYVVKLLEEQKLPHRKVGVRRRKILDELTARAQDEGYGY
jgi:excisionase family DNA binding protein